jgi:tetraacyldisaccharide 4'-kinase
VRYLLIPFSFLYGLIIAMRNLAFDLGIFRSTSFSIPIIVVGNLRVGGTGKTPMILALSELLQAKGSGAVLSRGYGRASRGYQLVQPDSTVEDCGDEPLLIKKKQTKLTVAVCENRVKGLGRILSENPMCQWALLDDAMQHRWVMPGHLILLTAYHDLYLDDALLPFGRLREPSYQARRADTIVVTKCPANLSPQDRRAVKLRIDPLPHQQVYFATEGYGGIISLNSQGSMEWDELRERDVVLVTGLADPRPLQDYLEPRVSSLHPMVFKDHHNFKWSDVQHIQHVREKLSENAIVLTTEKDGQRISKWLQNENFAGLKWYTLEHGVKWLDGEAQGLEIRIDDFIKSHSGIS